MITIEKCCICGKEFVKHSVNQMNYCSNCKELKKKKIKYSIADIQKMAEEHHMSYGKFVSLMEAGKYDIY